MEPFIKMKSALVQVRELIDEHHFVEKISPKPYYPFGEGGNINCEGCYEVYPLDGDDLQFENQHPLFGVRACSNVFSGAEHDLRGKRFDPQLRELTDEDFKELIQPLQ